MTAVAAPPRVRGTFRYHPETETVVATPPAPRTCVVCDGPAARGPAVCDRHRPTDPKLYTGVYL